MSRKSRSALREPGGGAVLAGLLGLLCEQGTRLRAAGRCCGDLRRSELDRLRTRLSVSDGHEIRAEGKADRETAIGELAGARYETHVRRGHDAGCRAFGIPTSVLNRSLRRWDTVGASGLIGEAVIEAIAEIDQEQSIWNAEAALASLDFALRKRITPVTVTAVTQPST